MTEQVNWPDEIPEDEIDLRCNEWRLMGYRVEETLRLRVIFAVNGSVDNRYSYCIASCSLDLGSARWKVKNYGDGVAPGCNGSAGCPFGVRMIALCYKYDSADELS